MTRSGPGQARGTTSGTRAVARHECGNEGGGPSDRGAGGPVGSGPMTAADRTASGIDLGLTHVALCVTDLDRSIAFYERFADLAVVHRRADGESGRGVAWLGDGTRPFVIVLIEQEAVFRPLAGFSHLGVALPSRDEVDRRVAEAEAAGHETLGPFDEGPPAGYLAFIADPDGNNLEVSHGQLVALTTETP